MRAKPGKCTACKGPVKSGGNAHRQEKHNVISPYTAMHTPQERRRLKRQRWKAKRNFIKSVRGTAVAGVGKGAESRKKAK